MLKFLKKLNTNLNLFKALGKKTIAFTSFLKQRKLLTFFIILVIGLGSFFAYRKFAPQPPEKIYELTTVSKQDVSKQVTASGIIISETQVDLKFQTAGQLAWVGVKKGDYVNQWQALASLDQRELKKNLQNELRDYSKERNDFEEDIRETYKDTVLTDTFKRILQKNQWDLEKTVLDVEIDDIALKFATLITPIAGIVTHIDVPIAGINITAAKAVFTIADPDNLIFQAQIDEADIGFLSASQSAQLILDAYPDESIPLTINRIDFNSTADSSGSTVYLVEFKLKNNSSQKFRLGMNGEVIINVAEKKDVLAIPYQSLIENDQDKVQIVQDKQVVDQPVTVGLIGEDFIEITSGLTSGQTIVVSKKSKK